MLPGKKEAVSLDLPRSCNVPLKEYFYDLIHNIGNI
jgi:hypothetical protein